MTDRPINTDNGFQQPIGNTNNEPFMGGIKGSEMPVFRRLVLNAVDSAGGVFSLENTTQETYIVDVSFINITTKTAGACTLDVGIAATATTLNDTLFDAADLGAAIDVLNNIDDAGTNGGIGVLWAPGEFITGSVASGASAGIVGSAMIRFVRA